MPETRAIADQPVSSIEDLGSLPGRPTLTSGTCVLPLEDVRRWLCASPEVMWRRYRPAAVTDEAVREWVALNPGVDAEHVAEHFGVSLVEADEALERLLNQGRLDFAE